MSLTEALGGFGKFWEPLGSFGRLLEGFDKLWEVLGRFGRIWKAWEGFGRLLNVLGGFGRFWEALAASVRLCKALVQWMLWNDLEALGVFDRYGRLFEGFRKL